MMNSPAGALWRKGELGICFAASDHRAPLIPAAGSEGGGFPLGEGWGPGNPLPGAGEGAALSRFDKSAAGGAP